MKQKEHWYENKSLIICFLDTPIGFIALLKNKKIKRLYRVLGCLAGLIGSALAISHLFN